MVSCRLPLTRYLLRCMDLDPGNNKTPRKHFLGFRVHSVRHCRAGVTIALTLGSTTDDADRCNAPGP